jgi:hypothetical protein
MVLTGKLLDLLSSQGNGWISPAPIQTGPEVPDLETEAPVVNYRGTKLAKNLNCQRTKSSSFRSL